MEPTIVRLDLAYQDGYAAGWAAAIAAAAQVCDQFPNNRNLMGWLPDDVSEHLADAIRALPPPAPGPDPKE